MHSHDFISVSVGEIRPNGEGNLSLILQAAAGEILPAYSAGAHIDIIIPGVGPRQYSLCGIPDRGNRYEVCVRLADASTGGSRYLHQQLKAGDRLSIRSRATISPCRKPGATCCLPAVSASRRCWRWLTRLPPERESWSCIIMSPARARPPSPRAWPSWPASGTVAIHCSEEGESFRQQIPPCLTAPDPDTAVVACGPEGFIQRLRSVMDEYRWSPSQFVFERFTPAAENNTAAKNAFLY